MTPEFIRHCNINHVPLGERMRHWQTWQAALEQDVNSFRMDALDAVMCSVDKWLEGKQLEEDPVNRAVKARELALCAIEKAEKLGLTETEWDQLRAYVRWAEESGTYYGRKDQFDKRHTNIRRAVGI